MSFYPSTVLRKKLSSSSQSWLARQSRDPYVKQRVSSPTSYRSRSAFKLLELDKGPKHFLSNSDVRAVVDLGAAPGGWSQVVAEKLGWVTPSTPENSYADLMPDFGLSDLARIEKFGSWSSNVGRGVIVAVDLLPIAPIPGVHTLQMDFLSPQAADGIKAALTTPENPSGMADVILSDMAANFTGNKAHDVEMSLDICHSVFEFAKNNLNVREVHEGVVTKRGGTLLLKHFDHPLSQKFRAKYLKPNFLSVNYIKPSASRAESAEGYWLCRGWKGVELSQELSPLRT